MIAAISGGYSQYYSQTQAVTATQDKTVKTDSAATQQSTVQLGADTATISVTAQALSLYQQGLTIEQIAIRLGVDVATVRRYLGMAAEEETAAVAANNTALNNLMRTVYQSAVDINTLRNFFGLSNSSSGTTTFQTTNGLSSTTTES